MHLSVPELQFKSVLGHFCSGVAVLTATLDDHPVGLTCQSFFSVSIDPPLVAFSVATSSTSFPSISRAGTCCVNVLASDQLDLSNRFARSGTDKWTGTSWHSTPKTGDPIVEGVLAWIECELEQEHDAGDHILVVARVLSLGARPDAEPLLYYKSQYAHLATAG